ncbi:DUF2790 domain-containing protein [Pseudomonas moorei]|jgi:hypothetical protein|uniref:Uncharacterized protein n=1 Tax=Pseudomonas moorei TaxID=395599 RepID=A0A1H1EU82_9PSED|nr:DUF2790 domain-containing protein [Pseudomonas moorei]KAB0507632.1 DUF2790 domain-containing protein [Pseudomonas moorei]SDQ92148.1 Protein of unknown function [Pseudomonas moorei]
MKTLLSVLLALTTTAVMAAESNPTATPPSLDIAKVISVTDTSTACDVVPATMVYIDHQGESHTLTYRVMGSCSGV